MPIPRLSAAVLFAATLIPAALAHAQSAPAPVPKTLEEADAQRARARQMRDDADRRNVLVQRTVKGSVFLRDFADLVTSIAGRLEA